MREVNHSSGREGVRSECSMATFAGDMPEAVIQTGQGRNRATQSEAWLGDGCEGGGASAHSSRGVMGLGEKTQLSHHHLMIWENY